MHSPFFLQEILLCSMATDEQDTGELREVWTHVVQAVRISQREAAFVEDICGELHTWFGDASRSSWSEVWKLISDRIQLVRFLSSRLHTVYHLCSSRT